MALRGCSSGPAKTRKASFRSPLCAESADWMDRWYSSD